MFDNRIKQTITLNFNVKDIFYLYQYSYYY